MSASSESRGLMVLDFAVMSGAMGLPILQRLVREANYSMEALSEAMVYAAQSENFEIVQFLLSESADPLYVLNRRTAFAAGLNPPFPADKISLLRVAERYLK